MRMEDSEKLLGLMVAVLPEVYQCRWGHKGTDAQCSYASGFLLTE